MKKGGINNMRKLKKIMIILLIQLISFYSIPTIANASTADSADALKNFIYNYGSFNAVGGSYYSQTYDNNIYSFVLNKDHTYVSFIMSNTTDDNSLHLEMKYDLLKCSANSVYFEVRYKNAPVSGYCGTAYINIATYDKGTTLTFNGLIAEANNAANRLLIMALDYWEKMLYESPANLSLKSLGFKYSKHLVIGDIFTYSNVKYQVTKISAYNSPGECIVVGCNSGAKSIAISSSAYDQFSYSYVPVKIQKKAFMNKKIKSFQILKNDRIKEIPEQCFSGCTKLKFAYLYGVNKISKKAFYNCNTLEQFEFKGNLTKAEKNAFKGCNTSKKGNNLMINAPKNKWKKYKKLFNKGGYKGTFYFNKYLG